MSLAPSCSVTLGNYRYDTHVIELHATLTCLPGANQVRFRLPQGTPLEAAPGDPAKVELDGGEGKQTVLTGKIQGIFPGIDGTEVWAADGGASLLAYRPASTFERQTAKDIVRALASDVSVDCGTLDMELRLAAYAAGQNRSAAEHIACLAALDGRIAYLDGDGALQVLPRPSGPADTALLYGRELVTCQARHRAAPAARRVGIGSGPAGTTDAPDALRPSLGPLPEDAAQPGVEAVWQASAILRTPEAANTAGQAADTALAARSALVRGRGFLMPHLRPGMVVEIQELPGSVGEKGPWLLQRVNHRLDSRYGATTFFEGETAGAADLLGGLLDMIGGLL